MSPLLSVPGRLVIGALPALRALHRPPFPTALWPGGCQCSTSRAGLGAQTGSGAMGGGLSPSGAQVVVGGPSGVPVGLWARRVPPSFVVRVGHLRPLAPEPGGCPCLWLRRPWETPSDMMQKEPNWVESR